jgi:small redox-active disulfide protein 2
MSADEYIKIRVGDDDIGIMGLKQAMEEIAASHADKTDAEVQQVLLDKLSDRNYMAKSALDEYGRAFVREFRKFLGGTYDEPGLEGLSIIVLGPGCSECNRLKQNVMQALTEMDLSASVEHVTEIEEIAKYGLASTPSLMVNGKPVSVGTVPSVKKIKELIR